jgi:hypothetical protein
VSALYQLLPEDGSPIELAVARAALSEQLSVEVGEDEFYRTIFADTRIQATPERREIRRKVTGINLEPPREIQNERNIEPWFERYLWQHRTIFHDPGPMSLNTVVENTARIHASPGRWTRPDLCMGCVARYRYTPSPQFDLFSFELKMPSGCNMLSVHEALAHGATAHFPYCASIFQRAPTNRRI